MRRTGHGFTLIELMLAVVLLALLTGAAALSFARPIHNARARQAIDTVERCDEMTREQARRFGKAATLGFDLHHQTIRRDSVPNVSLPSGFTIHEIRSAGHSIEAGEFSLDVSALGLSRSYALHLVGPELDRWMLVAGLSGEVTWTTNETQVEQFLGSATRDNAH